MASRAGKRRSVIFLVPLALAIAAIAADHIGIDGPNSGFGKTEAALLTLALIVFVVTLVDAKRHWTPRLLLAALSTYAALLVCDVILLSYRSLHPRSKPWIGLKGMYVTDAKAGYTLSPNWRGLWEDGIIKAEYKINSRGHRDDEPDARDGRRILLIGDSFTFGAMLDQSETIDKHIERLSDRRVDAYNIGVAGAGPPMILEYFRRCDWFNGTDVFYLFFNNDLRDDNLLTDLYTVVDGYIVRKYDPASGRRFTLEELKAGIRKRLSPPPPKGLARTVRDIIKIHHLRKSVKRGLVFVRPDPLFSGDEAVQFRPENVQECVAYTEKMRSLATERKMDFHVVILPTRGEAGESRYSDPTEGYLAEARKRGFKIVEYLPRVSTGHYISHDLHFNAEGAKETAKAIVEQLYRGEVKQQADP